MTSRSRGRAAVAALALAIAGAGCAASGQNAYSETNTSAGVIFGNARRGGAVFAAACAQCHGAGGEGGIGPALTGENHRKNYEGTVAWIEDPDPPMPHLYPSALSEQNVEDVATYVQSL